MAAAFIGAPEVVKDQSSRLNTKISCCSTYSSVVDDRLANITADRALFFSMVQRSYDRQPVLAVAWVWIVWTAVRLLAVRLFSNIRS